jgi:hypothetical protein
MALERRTVTLKDEGNPELSNMTRQFRVSLTLTLPLLVMAMAAMVVGAPVSHWLSGRLPTQLVLAMPGVRRRREEEMALTSPTVR